MVDEAAQTHGKENGTKWIFEKVDLADKEAIDRSLRFVGPLSWRISQCRQVFATTLRIPMHILDSSFPRRLSWLGIRKNRFICRIDFF